MPAQRIAIDLTAQAIADVVALVEGDDAWLQRGVLLFVDMDGVADDSLVAALAATGGAITGIVPEALPSEGQPSISLTVTFRRSARERVAASARTSERKPSSMPGTADLSPSANSTKAAIEAA